LPASPFLQDVASIDKFAGAKGFINERTAKRRKVGDGAVEQPGDELFDQGELPFMVGVERGEDLGCDISLPDDLHAGVFETAPPFVDVGSIAEVRIQEIAAMSEHTADFRDECFERGVAMRRLHIDDGVERLRLEGQALRIALVEFKPVDRVGGLTEIHRVLGEVDADHLQGTEISLDECGSAAPAATHFEHVRLGEIDRAGHMVVELNAVSICFLFRRQL